MDRVVRIVPGGWVGAAGPDFSSVGDRYHADNPAVRMDDVAVRDPAAPNQINPDLLASSGYPSEEFDRRLAQAVTDAVEGFPPLTL